jgi:chromosome segregation ATPase
MFKFVNLQSNEIEELEFEVSGLREELGQGEAPALNDKQKFLLEMEDNLRNVEANLKDTETKYRNCQKEARGIMGLIERIFETI